LGFSGGGANVTKAHQHDSAVVQDGGSLAANATQFGLTNGSLLYSDGTNIQELGVGASGYVLGTASGTVPTWEAAATGGGGSMTLINNTQASSTTTTIDTTFTNIPGDDMAELYCVSAGCNGGFAIDVQLYDEGTNLLTSANYSNHGYTIISGTQTIINTTGQTEFNAVPGSFEPHYVIMHITLGRCGGAGIPYFPKIQTFACGDTGVSHIGGTFSNATKPTGIAGIKFGVSGSNSIENGTYLAIYQVKNV
jgi:hypothetical protein